MKKSSSGILLVFFMILPLSLVFGAAFDSASIKRDPKFFYGFGTGKTVQEAQQLALNDLISDALSASQPAKANPDARVAITTEMSKAFPVGDIKPFLNQKDNNVCAVGYRIERAAWTKLEAPRETELRTDMLAQFTSISGNASKALPDRLVEGAYLLLRLSNEGVYDVLTDTEGGTVLISKTIETFYTNLIAGLKSSLTPESGLVHSGTVFVVAFTGKDGKALASLPLGYSWRTAKKASAIVVASTDDQGKFTLPYPADDSYKNRAVWLKVSTGFAAKVPESRFLADLDKSLSREFSYRQLEEAGKIAGNEVKIPAGDFMAGALKHDRRAAATKEKPRQVKLNAFAIDRYPVTNALYGAYLDDAKVPESEWPDYWDNPDYNQPTQPVIGISWSDATKFAKWLSSRLGYTKRLPTEDEYERAARGDLPVIYPWGDQPATDSVRANYNGNKRFDSTSPIGSFENGKNAADIYDLSGNVWEWTSSVPDANMTDDPSWKLVKGGSWMDGPSELRISNRRALDPTQRYQDVGFRLVREVTE